jgi:hypothetical protein
MELVEIDKICTNSFPRRVYEASAVFDCGPKRFEISTVIPVAESDFGQANTRVGLFS